MAQKNSKADIFRSEKYMDDAVSSAFFNLYKGAKRKSDYIWATQKFSSLDSIWSDPVDKVLDDTSELNKNPKFESKILKQQYYGIDNKQNTSQVHESNPVEVAIKSTSQVHESNPVEVAIQSTSQVHEYNPVELIKLDNAQKIGLHPEQIIKVPANRKVSLSQNFGDNNEGKSNKSKYSNPANKALNADEQYAIGVKQEILKRNPVVDCRISGKRYEWNQEISQMKQNFRGIGTLKPENHPHCISRDAEKTPRITSFEKSRFKVASNAEKKEDMKSRTGETEFQKNCIKSKTNYSDKQLKEKAIERVKRKRHMSSSVNSLPEQKHFPTKNQKPGTDKSSMLKTLLELKIFKGDKVFDFTLELSDFNRMKKRFPKLEDVLPEINGNEKELNYSADAIKIVLGFLRNLRYPTPDERTAIEVLAATKSWGMYQFYEEFKQKFSEILNRNNVRLAYGAAVYYGLGEICDVYKCAFNDDLTSSNRPYRPRKCNISVSPYIEPREFCIPSKISASTLQDNFNKDIRNEIIFKAVAGSYVITGFHILLNIDNENETDSFNLEFFYVVRNFKSSYEEELKVCKPLRRNIVIHLKRSLVVNQDETAEIVVESSIKPYLCFAVQENNLVGRCDESHFSLNVTSTYKVKNSNEKRFLIGKLLYYPKT